MFLKEEEEEEEDCVILYTIDTLRVMFHIVKQEHPLVARI